MAQPADLVALLDPLCAGRVYRGKAPQGVSAPYIEFQKVASNPVNHLLGADGTKNTRWQIDVWADDTDAADALMASIRTAFESYPEYVDLGDNPEPYDETAQLHGASADFSVWHV